MLYVNAQAWRANRPQKSNGTNIENQFTSIFIAKGTFLQQFRPLRGGLNLSEIILQKI
jgi:hypothetical protein